VPQLTFDREDSPQRISVNLIWDQLHDRWQLSIYCASQSEKQQGAANWVLADGFNATQLCFSIAQAFEDWIDLTPAYAIAQLGKAIRVIDPIETAQGLRPDRLADQSAPLPPWHARGYRAGQRRQP